MASYLRVEIRERRRTELVLLIRPTDKAFDNSRG